MTAHADRDRSEQPRIGWHEDGCAMILGYAATCHCQRLTEAGPDAGRAYLQSLILSLKQDLVVVRSERDDTHRALAGERAKVARVEALVEAFEQEECDLGAASYHLAGDAQDASDDLARESETWRTAASRLRAALAGPEPHATEDGA